MSLRAEGWFEIAAFEEKPVAEKEGLRKLGRASLTLRFQGGLEREAVSQSVLASAPWPARRALPPSPEWTESKARSAAAQAASFSKAPGPSTLLRAKLAAPGQWVTGSATGALVGLRGEGR